MWLSRIVLYLQVKEAWSKQFILGRRTRTATGHEYDGRANPIDEADSRRFPRARLLVGASDR